MGFIFNDPKPFPFGLPADMPKALAQPVVGRIEQLTDKPVSGYAFLAAAPKVINEKLEQLVAERDQALAEVDRLVDILADRTRERDEAQLEVERLKERVLDLEAMTKDDADTIDKLRGRPRDPQGNPA